MSDLPVNGVFNLQSFDAYRTMWALCDIRRTDTGQVLNVSHFAVCLLHGRDPMWGLFSARTGKLERFYGQRYQIEAVFPKKVWRRKIGAWSLGQVEDEVPRSEIVRMLTAQVSPTVKVIAA